MYFAQDMQEYAVIGGFSGGALLLVAAVIMHVRFRKLRYHTLYLTGCMGGGRVWLDHTHNTRTQTTRAYTYMHAFRAVDDDDSYTQLQGGAPQLDTSSHLDDEWRP